MSNTWCAKEGTQYACLELRMLSHQHILQDRHIVEKANILKSTSNAALNYRVRLQTHQRPASKTNITRSRSINAGNQIEDRGFSGTIWTNNANDLFRPDPEIDVLYCCKATKVFRYFTQFQEWTIRMSVGLFNTHRNLLSATTQHAPPLRSLVLPEPHPMNLLLHLHRRLYATRVVSAHLE